MALIVLEGARASFRETKPMKEKLGMTRNDVKTALFAKRGIPIKQPSHTWHLLYVFLNHSCFSQKGGDVLGGENLQITAALGASHTFPHLLLDL